MCRSDGFIRLVLNVNVVEERMLTATSVCTAFGGLKAVDMVSLAVRKGEIYGIIGPNGAGKSTLLNILSGITEATTGKIDYKGVDITRWGAYKRARHGMARTFQAAQSFNRHTVHENMIAGAVSRIESWKAWRRWMIDSSTSKKIAKVLEDAGLGMRREKYPQELNNLELQKLSIAMSLMLEPELLLLDEPSGGLIEAEVVELERYLRQINGTGITLVIVDHKMSLIGDLCDNISVMAMGQVIARGSGERVFNDAEVRRVYLGEG